jgi:hypothetical protein
MAKEPKDPNDIVWPEDMFMEDCFLKANRDPAKEKARRTRNARCGHIARRLRRKEPLTGDLLKFALDLVEPEPGNKDDFSQFAGRIATKLKHGMPLDDYEGHIMEEVFLLNARLSP